MKITTLILENIRSFESTGLITFSPKINLFIGSNNTGKSTLLYSLYMLQRKYLSENDILVGKENGSIKIGFNENANNKYIKTKDGNISILLKPFNIRVNSAESFHPIPEREPDNIFYPFFTNRKVNKYQETINSNYSEIIDGTLSNLYIKIDKVNNPDYQPVYDIFNEACKEVFGFKVTTIQNQNGKMAAYIIDINNNIPMTSMGSGIPSIIGIIAYLADSENKIFIIEEPENDIHPEILKKLLNFIISRSKSNQIFITTHSNIVLRILGSEVDTKIFEITSNKNSAIFANLYNSSITEVDNSIENRIKILEKLGYELYDHYLWEKWLFLEESSIETIVKEFLIKWFTPGLIGKLRTFSTNGIEGIIPKFENFNRLFLYMHLEPIYKNMAWVLIDNGEREKEIISKLREIFIPSGWDRENFINLSKKDFESYYPEIFRQDVEKILIEKDHNKKREMKNVLLNKVKDWVFKDEELAKKELEKSCSEIIDFLKKIESKKS